LRCWVLTGGVLFAMILKLPIDLKDVAPSVVQ
jgi:hypothetical protein